MNGQIEPSEEILFFFSQINPLDNIPVRFIKRVEIFDEKVTFDIVGDDGLRRAETKIKTRFMMNQLEGFELVKS